MEILIFKKKNHVIVHYYGNHTFEKLPHDQFLKNVYNVKKNHLKNICEYKTLHI